MIKSHELGLFSTPLYILKTDIEDHKNIKEKYLKIIYDHNFEFYDQNSKNLDPHQNNYTSNTNGRTSFYTGSLLKRVEFNEIQQYINNIITNFLIQKEQIDHFDLRWLDFWYTIYDKNTRVEEHFHPNSIISGVLYLKCPKNCGDIIFIDNNYSFKNFCVNISPLKTYTYPKTFKVTPEEGMILLFPSWLMHKTENNQNEDDKIMLAFNLQPTFKDSSFSEHGSNAFGDNK